MSDRPVRSWGRAALVIAAMGVLSTCGSSSQPSGPGAEFGEAGTDSSIAGETLHCAADYPDSRLVFESDGTLDGRFAGSEVHGLWRAPDPDRVRMVLKTGGITVRDTFRRTAGGWQGGVTACS